MDNKKLLTGAGIIAVILVVFFFWRKSQDQELPPVPAPPPTPPKGNGIVSGAVKTLPLSDPELQAAIRERVKFIVRNERAREAAYEAAGVRKGVFTGLQYGSGMRQALAAALPDGNPNNVPVIPPSVNPEYSDRLALIPELTDYETIDNTSGTQAARNQWQSASDMADVGFSFWPPNMDQLVEQGAFFVSGPADKNKSERYDSFTRDLKKLATNLLTANRKAADALESAAITELLAAGWKIQGFSF